MKILRCPTKKERSPYNTCGAFLGAIDTNKLIIYCARCNESYEIELLNNSVSMKKLPKERINNEPYLRVITS